MSGITAASLYANVSVTGGAATSSALRGVGGEVTNAQRALSAFGGVGGAASKGLGLLERGAGGVGSAFTHLKGTVGGLIAGPLGFLGLGAGVLGLAGALKSGIDTANTMALSIEKLTGVTGLSAEKASALIAVFGKFGVDTAQTSQIAGFAEKTIGKLSETSAKAGKSTALLTLEQEKLKIEVAGGSTKAVDALIKRQTALDASNAAAAGGITKLTALDKQYGISLIDAKGNAVDFETELLRVADYYNGNATAGQKAALAATLFGRGYATIIPILKLGSAGILEAEAAAKSLGLTLTETNVADLKAYQETMRNLGDAVGGLQLQLSLALVPAIKDVATAATGFIANNRAGIVDFFKTLIVDARTAAGFLTGTVIPDLESLAGAATGFWNQIPGPLKDILIKGLIADRAMKFLFGFDPATAIGSIIAKQLLGGLASGIGAIFGKVASTVGGTAVSKLAPQDVFVVNMPLGGIPGAGGAAGGGEAAAGGAAGIGLGTVVGSAAAIAAAAVLILNANQGRTDLAGKAAAGDPVAIRTQNELGTRGMQNPTAGGGMGPVVSAVNQVGDRIDKSAAGSMASLAAFDRSQQSTIGNLSRSEHADAMIVSAAVKESAAHGAAIAAITKVDGSIHNLLTTFRGGSAKVAINDFPRELAYLSTASDAQKKTAVYSSGIRQDITALQHAEVGATGAQKAALQADIKKLQALQAAPTLALKAIQAKATAEAAHLAAIQSSSARTAAKEWAVQVTSNFNVSGARVAEAVIRLKSGVRVT